MADADPKTISRSKSRRGLRNFLSVLVIAIGGILLFATISLENEVRLVLALLVIFLVAAVTLRRW